MPPYGAHHPNMAGGGGVWISGAGVEMTLTLQSESQEGTGSEAHG
jgi:hypothetical protein